MACATEYINGLWGSIPVFYDVDVLLTLPLEISIISIGYHFTAVGLLYFVTAKASFILLN